MSHDVIVVRERDLPSIGRVFWRGFLAGALVFFAFVLLLLVAGATLLTSGNRFLVLYVGIAVPTVLIFAPLTLLVRRQARIAVPQRALFGSLGYACGIAALPVCTGVPVALTQWDLERCMLLVSVATLTIYGYGIAGWLTGIFFFRKFARVVIQDGTLCPECAYSLVGNTSMICPECGRAFTAEELGTTAEALVSGRELGPV